METASNTFSSTLTYLFSRTPLKLSEQREVKEKYTLSENYGTFKEYVDKNQNCIS